MRVMKIVFLWNTIRSRDYLTRTKVGSALCRILINHLKPVSTNWKLPHCFGQTIIASFIIKNIFCFVLFRSIGSFHSSHPTMMITNCLPLSFPSSIMVERDHDFVVDLHIRLISFLLF